MDKQLTKQDILNELHGIQNYMEEKDAFHGYGQMTDLIKKLENECDGNPANSKPANCAIFDVSKMLRLLDKDLSLLELQMKALQEDIPRNLRERKGDVKDLEVFDMKLNAMRLRLERVAKNICSNFC